jgi:hypothetical protein
MSLGTEVEIRGDDVRARRTYLTDPSERANYERMKEAGKGFLLGSKGQIAARAILRIPVDDAMFLKSVHDPDWTVFEACGDKGAMRRLLARFPYWRVAEGGI